jgi:hypothetical protein
MREQGPAADLMQYFGMSRPHPGPLTRRENDGLQWHFGSLTLNNEAKSLANKKPSRAMKSLIP